MSPGWPNVYLACRRRPNSRDTFAFMHGLDHQVAVVTGGTFGVGPGNSFSLADV